MMCVCLNSAELSSLYPRQTFDYWRFVKAIEERKKEGIRLFHLPITDGKAVHKLLPLVFGLEVLYLQIKTPMQEL
jgi:hypothetical protein